MLGTLEVHVVQHPFFVGRMTAPFYCTDRVFTFDPTGWRDFGASGSRLTGVRDPQSKTHPFAGCSYLGFKKFGCHVRHRCVHNPYP